VTRPGRCGADESPLTKILDDINHAGEVNLTDADRRRLYIWLDGNVTFYGAYSDKERLAQQRGEAISPPALQ
jgi:hypothetical protein